MSFFIRLFDLATTFFFALWMLLHLFEMYDLSYICLAAVIFFAACMFGLRLFVFYKITQRRLEDL
jgi:hypothetical protein